MAIYVLLLLVCCRLGEARNPGPMGETDGLTSSLVPAARLAVNPSQPLRDLADVGDQRAAAWRWLPGLLSAR